MSTPAPRAGTGRAGHPRAGTDDGSELVVSYLLERSAAAWIAPDAVGLRNLPTTVSIALVLVVLERAITPAHPTLLVVAGAVVLAAQGLASAGAWGRWPTWLRAVIPLSQMAAVALIDVGAGLTMASFDILLVLPMGNLALRPERWGPPLALAGLALVFLTPVVVDVGRVQPLVHAVVTFAIVTPVVLGAHGVVHAARRQATALERARDALAERAAELRVSRDNLRSIMNAATEQAILATDAQGVVVAASSGAERVLSRRAEEVVGHDVTDLLGTDDTHDVGAGGTEGAEDGTRPPMLDRLVGVAATGGTRRLDAWRLVLPDGTSRFVEVVITRRPSAGGPGTTSGYLVVATDVTARQEEERRQDEFIGLVTHELRTPLTSIIGYLELLELDDHGLGDEQRRYLASVQRNAERLRALVDELLASAQLVVGAPMSVTALDVVEVVRSVLASQEPMARAAGVTLGVVGDEVVPLESDEQRLSQVVENLVSNAVKYSLSGGHVTVDVRAGTRPDRVRTARVTVTDDGTGIAPDELARITERFYRTRDTRRRRVRGVGLGLSLVQAIVDEHDGTLVIDSEPGKGTRVEVVLPDLPVPADDVQVPLRDP